MHNPKPALVALLASLAVLQLDAQPASPELLDRAVQLLRQTIATEPAPSSAAPSSVRVVPPPTPAVAPLPVAPTMPQLPPATPAQQQAALELLRGRILEEQALKTSTPQTSASERSWRKKTPPKEPQTTVRPVAQEAPAPETTIIQPAVSQTKQQRLMELLERYKADQLTPAEYHAERAKILAEP